MSIAAVLALLQSKIGLMIGGASLGFILPRLVKGAGGYFGGLEKKALDGLFAINVADPKEKDLLNNFILSGIALAEYKLPDRGQGSAKKDMVLGQIKHILPGIPGEVAASLVQEAFDSLDDAMKVQLGVNKP